MKKYSVIIPHKNCPELLHRCITSIPSNGDFEIILVDDGSDNIETVKKNIEALNRNDLRVVYSECGRGAGYSRNVGIRESSGEWILFLDADDFFTETIADIVKITESTEADIVYFKHQGKYSDNLEDCIRVPIRNELISHVLNNNCEKNRTRLKFGDIVPWGKIYRRSLISKHNIVLMKLYVAKM